jgi:hypothetical protein
MIPAAEAPGVAQVIEALEQRRKEAHTSMIGSINGERYIALLDRLVKRRKRRSSARRGRTRRDIVSDLVEGPWRHLRAAVNRAGKHPDDAELHTVRIRVKRVRYAADAVVPILGKSPAGSPTRRRTSRRSWGSTTMRWSPGPGCGPGPPGDAREMRVRRRHAGRASSAPPPTTRAGGGARRGSSLVVAREAM